MRVIPVLAVVVVVGVSVGALAGCRSSTGIGPVRFVNSEPVWHVDDRADVPEPPAEHPYYRMSFHFHSYYLRMVRGFSLTRHLRARGVNAIDEVPSSTWFTNRLAVREVTTEELVRGPGKPSPEQYKPWTITSSKAGGLSLGFIAEDTRGVKFILKFDRKTKPEIETATDAICSRLMWAMGYNVPSNHVIYFRREDLKIAPDAYTRVSGKKLPLDAAVLDRKLAGVTRESDGETIRGLASIFVEGKTLGGAPRTGVRKDDPNDKIPHELRRDQRGLAAPFAWLSHTDMREDQTLDTWQEDPADKSVRYVMHYLVDFGNALDAALANQDYLGFEYDIDPEEALASTLSLGLYPRGGKDRNVPAIRGVGLYTAQGYEPGTWKPNNPGHFPIIWADRFDKFWGAKLLIRFTREQLAAAVSAGRLTDPRAAPYLVATLIERQRMTARYWFERVNPIDELTYEAGRLCFTDLALRHQLETAATRFRARAFDAAGTAVPPPAETYADANGRACLQPVLAAGTHNYTVLHIESSRGMPGTQVHLATEPATGKPRVIGIHRL